MVLGYAGSASVGTEATDNLQAAYVRTLSHQDCIGLYEAADINQHFCANDVERQSNFCLGDQGGSVTILIRDKEFLVNFNLNSVY